MRVLQKCLAVGISAIDGGFGLQKKYNLIFYRLLSSSS
jgi:hypothetical protein